MSKRILVQTLWSASLFVGFVSVAFAEGNWTKFFRNDGATHFIDKTTIKNSGVNTVVWAWVKFDKPFVVPAFPDDITYSMKVKLRANCAEETLWKVQQVSYDNEGNVLQKVIEDFESVMPPGSVGEAAFNIMCRSKRK